MLFLCFKTYGTEFNRAYSPTVENLSTPWIKLSCKSNPKIPVKLLILKAKRQEFEFTLTKPEYSSFSKNYEKNCTVYTLDLIMLLK